VKFVEAVALAASARGLPEYRLRLGMSGTAETLLPFLCAQAARRGFDLRVEPTTYGALTQYLLGPVDAAASEALVLFPWDFLPEFDWRTGLRAAADDAGDAARRASRLAEAIDRRKSAAILFVDAPLPPVLSRSAEARAVARQVAEGIGALRLGPECFSLGSYLATGASIGGSKLSEVAEILAAALFDVPKGQGKVLVTDFDNVLWSGTAADDGAEGVVFGPAGRGYRHFLYQGFLANLKASGILLAGVTRNELAAALAPLARSDAPLRADDFVTIRAGYGAKSAEIKALAASLGLGLEAFLFIDDSEVELAEVGSGAPAARRLRFPDSDDALPRFFELLTHYFRRSGVTAEDRDRTALYRRRLATMPPTGAGGGDLTVFLKDLRMRLVVEARRAEEATRALQLINKTNQFNANGRRRSAEELRRILDEGGRLYVATLDDRSGTHGEIVACLLDVRGDIISFVMSCRVFERKVEYAFCRWLAARKGGKQRIDFVPTEKNKPFALFLEALGAPADQAATVEIAVPSPRSGEDPVAIEDRATAAVP